MLDVRPSQDTTKCPENSHIVTLSLSLGALVKDGVSHATSDVPVSLAGLGLAGGGWDRDRDICP